ncbi:MAG: hypothetical protein H8K07_14135 [Nitrospira sp.]|jgi:hypothetical protein|nr:hypothetical protein [Nitrospira sp.]MDI3466006.1 hypothetical protein [Nitrospira sp.]
MTFKILLLITCVAWAGCVHRIQVTPLPQNASAIIIPRTLQAVISPVSMEGPDHRPGIVLLEWSHLDLKQAVLRYLQQRGTFASVSFDSGDLTLRVATKLTLTTRNNLYHYRIGLQAEMSAGVRPIKAYRAEHTAVGSSVRWVTASDRDPVEIALQAALEDLMRQVEADRPIYINPAEQTATEVVG